MQFKNCISDGEFLRNDYFPKVIEIEYNCDIMDVLLKVWKAKMWKIQKLFQWHGGHGARSGILLWGGVWDVSGRRYSHCRKYWHDIIASIKRYHSFVSTKEVALFVASRNCSASFLVHVKVSAEECKTCGASSIVFINFPSTLEKLLGSNSQ